MTDYLEAAAVIANGEPFIDAFDEVTTWAAPFGLKLLSRAPVHETDRILDAGCGTGFPLLELAARAGSGVPCVGIDIQHAALQRANRKRTATLRSRVDLVRADVSAIPFRSATFDLVVSNLGVNNFADPTAAMAELARVTQTGGRLLVTTNIKGHFAEFYGVLRNVLERRGMSDALVRLRENENHRGTIETLTSLITTPGFAIRTVECEDLVLRYRDGSALLNHPLTMIGFLPAWRDVVGAAQEHEVFAEVEDLLNRKAAREGGLSMTVPLVLVDAVRV